MPRRISRSIFAAFAVCVLSAASTEKAEAVVINYQVTPRSGDAWSGTFDIADLNATVKSTTTGVITATGSNGDYSFTFTDFIPTTDWLGDNNSFSTDFSDWTNAVKSDSTWQDIVNIGTFNGNERQYVYYYQDSPSLWLYEASGGSINFSVASTAAPGPLPALGLASAFAYSRSLRKKLKAVKH